MPKQKNIAAVSDLREKIAKAKSVVLTDYRGLTHKQSEELHRAVKKVEGEYVIAKNSLLRIASGESDFKLQATDLVGPTGALLAYGDELAPLKELYKFIKSTTLPKVKFGFIGTFRYESGDIDRVAKLPAKDVLQGQVVSRLASPLYGLTYSLNYNLQKLVFVLSQIKR